MLAAGCGGEPQPAQPFSEKLQTATCEHWKEASPQGRQAAIDRLERVVAGPHEKGKTLTDELAYSTLDARCKPEFAHDFLLYELYIRAAAFSSLAE